MGKFINPGNEGFKNIISGKYVDRTGMISLVNGLLNTSDKLICVSRPRRFGKSFAAKMLSAYYDRSCDSDMLFKNFTVHDQESYGTYLNKFNVVYLDITDFISGSVDEMRIVDEIRSALVSELSECYKTVDITEKTGDAFVKAVDECGVKFVFIIDEWDALFREFPSNENLQKRYISLLRELFKNGNVTDRVVAGAYITGILPIKKYGTQSAVSDFIEYTMTSPGDFAEYIGFTQPEVKSLCEDSGMPFDDAKRWYDGYYYDNVGSVYNPNSLMTAIKKRKFSNYWGKTESYESIVPYLNMDFDGLKQDVISLLGNGRVAVDIDSYQNDMVSIRSRDDVFALLVHLGYLGYDSDSKKVYIPNEEARQEFARAIKNSERKELAGFIKLSDDLLRYTHEMNSEAVARVLADIHETGVAPLYYNDEQSLRYVIRFAYLSAIDSYIRIEELPSGQGYADVVYLPKRHSDMPAMLIELKWDKPVYSAIDQIKEKHYPKILDEYGEDFLMIGITYNSATKEHSCIIEKCNVIR